MNSSRLKRAYDMMATNSRRAAPDETRMAAKKFFCGSNMSSARTHSQEARDVTKRKHLIRRHLQVFQTHPAGGNVHDAHPLHKSRTPIGGSKLAYSSRLHCWQLTTAHALCSVACLGLVSDRWVLQHESLLNRTPLRFMPKAPVTALTSANMSMMQLTTRLRATSSLRRWSRSSAIRSSVSVTYAKGV